MRLLVVKFLFLLAFELKADQDFLRPVIEEAQYGLDYVDQQFGRMVNLSRCIYDFTYNGSDICRFLGLSIQPTNKSSRHRALQRMCSDMDKGTRDKRDLMSRSLAKEVTRSRPFRDQYENETRGVLREYLRTDQINSQDIRNLCPSIGDTRITDELLSQIRDLRASAISKLIVGTNDNSLIQGQLDQDFSDFRSRLGSPLNNQNDREVLAALKRQITRRGRNFFSWCKEIITPPQTFYESYVPFADVSCKFEDERICSSLMKVERRDRERREGDSKYSQVLRTKVLPMFTEIKEKMMRKIDEMCLSSEVKDKMKAKLARFNLFIGKIQDGRLSSGCLSSACCDHESNAIYFSPEYVAEAEAGQLGRIRATLYHELGHATDLVHDNVLEPDISMYTSQCNGKPETIGQCILDKYGVREGYQANKSLSVASEAYADEMKLDLIANDYDQGVISKPEILRMACVAYLSEDDPPSFNRNTSHPHGVDRASALLLHPRIQNKFNCRYIAPSRSCIERNQ